MKIIVKSVENMKEIGRETAEKAVNGKKQNAIIIALTGELGSGKTTFAQGFLGYFGVKKANSPTFVIMKKYLPTKIFIHPPKLQKNLRRVKKMGERVFYLYHIDCYRIRNSRDLLELGFGEIVNDSRDIILIEWAERVSDLLPKDTIRISFKHKSEKERVVEIFNF